MVLKIDQVFNFPTALRKGLSSKHKTGTPIRFCKYVWDSVSYSIPASSWDCIEFIYCQHYPATGVVISKTLPLWNEEWQYTSSSRNGLENTPPRPSILPSGFAFRQCLGPQRAYFPIHRSLSNNVSSSSYFDTNDFKKSILQK